MRKSWKPVDFLKKSLGFTGLLIDFWPIFLSKLKFWIEIGKPTNFSSLSLSFFDLSPIFLYLIFQILKKIQIKPIGFSVKGNNGSVFGRDWFDRTKSNQTHRMHESRDWLAAPSTWLAPPHVGTVRDPGSAETWAAAVPGGAGCVHPVWHRNRGIVILIFTYIS
jgi:hypothetical protein